MISLTILGLDIDKDDMEGLYTWGYLIIPGVSRSSFNKLHAIVTPKNSCFFFVGDGETLKSVQRSSTDTQCHVKKLKGTVY